MTPYSKLCVKALSKTTWNVFHTLSMSGIRVYCQRKLQSCAVMSKQNLAIPGCHCCLPFFDNCIQSPHISKQHLISKETQLLQRKQLAALNSSSGIRKLKLNILISQREIHDFNAHLFMPTQGLLCYNIFIFVLEVSR